jgi:hypothetical protein
VPRLGADGIGMVGVNVRLPLLIRPARRSISVSTAGRVTAGLVPMIDRRSWMPTVIGHHDVKDTDHWLASPRREEFFGPLGVTNIRTFVNPQNPTQVAVLMDVADMDALAAAMESPGAAEAMEHDGVLPETLVLLVEA